MFVHRHPYPPFIPKSATKLIVGTLPPPRFSQGLIKLGDVEFCYGSRDGLLWPTLDRIFNLKLLYENTEQAINQRKLFLQDRGIGICDIVESCERIKIDATDLGMQQIVLRDLMGVLDQHTHINELIFTGGNSKNGPEYLFRRHLKGYGKSLELVTNDIPRIHKFYTNKDQREITTVSLTAPSGSANRAIGAMEEYKLKKKLNPSYNTTEFRVEQYRRFFQ